MKTKKKIIYIILLFAIFSAAIIISFPKKSERRILIILSYERSYPPYPDLNNRIKNTFKEEGINPDIRTIYANCEYLLDSAEHKNIYDGIQNIISHGWKPEIILTNGDQATYSTLMSNHPLVKRIPIVFVGVNYPNWSLLKHFPNVTGFEDKIDVMANLSFIKKLMKSDINIYTSLDSIFLDRKIREDVVKQLKGKPIAGRFTTPKLTFKKLTELKNDSGYTIFDCFPMRMKIAGGNKTKLIWPQIRTFEQSPKNNCEECLKPISDYIDGICYLQLKGDLVTRDITGISVNPCFSAVDANFGYNEKVVGGYMTTLKIQTKDEVNYAVRILKGESIKKLPIAKSSKEYIANWNSMQFFGINEKELPYNCRIINKPFKNEYPKVWISIVITSSIVIILLSIFCYKLIKRKQTLHKALLRERNILKLSHQSGKVFAWAFEKGYFTFDSSYWKNQVKEKHKISLSELEETIHPDFRHILSEEIINSSRRSKGIFQLKIATNKQDYSWWEIRYILVKEPNGSKSYYGLSINIDDIKHKEFELEKLRMRAEKIELKQSFLENINHEIRTPLNYIIGFSNILANNNSDLKAEEKATYIDIVNKSNENLLKIIDHIFIISQLISNEITLRKDYIPLKDTLNNVLNSFKEKTSKGIKLISDFNAELPNNIIADKKYFPYVIQHLIENALKFTEEGIIKLSCKKKPREESIEISVEDSGRGINTEDLNVIFNQFYKCDKFTEGTGLGLTICKLLTEKMGGKIEVESTLGKGSRFIIIFPL